MIVLFLIFPSADFKWAIKKKQDITVRFYFFFFRFLFEMPTARGTHLILNEIEKLHLPFKGADSSFGDTLEADGSAIGDKNNSKMKPI